MQYLRKRLVTPPVTREPPLTATPASPWPHQRGVPRSARLPHDHNHTAVRVGFDAGVAHLCVQSEPRFVCEALVEIVASLRGRRPLPSVTLAGKGGMRTSRGHARDTDCVKSPSRQRSLTSGGRVRVVSVLPAVVASAPCPDRAGPPHSNR
eukprot:7048143-Prymnesium_polylepis.1